MKGLFSIVFIADSSLKKEEKINLLATFSFKAFKHRNLDHLFWYPNSFERDDYEWFCLSKTSEALIAAQPSGQYAVTSRGSMTPVAQLRCIGLPHDSTLISWVKLYARDVSSTRIPGAIEVRIMSQRLWDSVWWPNKA